MILFPIAPASADDQAHGVPALVFVSRNRSTDVGQIAGLGPYGRTLAVGGRLLVREKDGRLRPLLADSLLFDVSDPAVSYDGRRVVFAGLARPDSAWRLYLVNADGSGFRALTHSNRVLDLTPLGPLARRFARYDDIDPCWLPDGRIVFASTRFPQTAQQRHLPVTNLFVVRPDGGGLERITTERNGGDEPTIDPRSGRIVYSRWLFNPYLPSDRDPWGLTLDRSRAVPISIVDDWQAVSIFPDGDRMELAAGNPRSLGRTGGSQPCVLSDGSVVTVEATDASLVPGPVMTALVVSAFGVGARQALTDVEDAEVLASSDPHPMGVASPCVLPDGRIVYASDPEGGGFGLFVRAARAGGVAQGIVDLPGTDELDPAPLIKRKVPPVIGPQGGIDDPAWTLPVTRLDQVRRGHDTFRFDDLNVFATGPVDSPFPDAPKIANKVRIRFFAALARPEAATGDTVVLVREAKLEDSGAVHESDIPGDVPMFEQLVDDLGHVLRSSRGPAHVPGFNFARTGSGTKCIGCHAGHSALPVPRNYLEAKWFNASTSADVAVSGGGDGALLVDRRAKGPIRETGWVAGSEGEPWARLKWAIPIEAKALVLYAPTSDGAAGTDLQVRGCDVILLRDGREVGHASAGRVRPQGTRIEFPTVRIDAVELRRFRVKGGVERRPAVALAEIETIARMIE